MKQIINNKLYDTNKTTHIFSFRQNYPYESIFQKGIYFNNWKEVEYLKTEKGTYLLHNTDDKKVEIVQEDEVKDTLKKLDTDKYIELFGEVEEG